MMPLAQCLPVLEQCTLSSGGGNQFAVLIAADRGQIESNETICGARRIKRPVEVVSQVDDKINATGADIGKNGLQRPKVSVNVGDRGKAESRHGALKLTQIQ